jgi:hypothetical protein
MNAPLLSQIEGIEADELAPRKQVYACVLSNNIVFSEAASREKRVYEKT